MNIDGTLCDRYPYLIICCSILDILSTLYIDAAILASSLQYTSGIRMRSTRLCYVIINKHMLSTLVLSYFNLVSNFT